MYLHTDFLLQFVVVELSSRVFIEHTTHAVEIDEVHLGNVSRRSFTLNHAVHEDTSGRDDQEHEERPTQYVDFLEADGTAGDAPGSRPGMLWPFLLRDGTRRKPRCTAHRC